MQRRMFIGLCVLSSLNLVLFFGSYAAAANAPGSGVEGLGSAMVGYLSLFISMFLAGYGLNQILVEAKNGPVSLRAVAATLLAAVPIMFYVFAEVLPKRLSPTQ